MNSSIYLGKVIGLYLIIASFGLLICKDRFKKLFKDATVHPFFITFSGFLSLILGLLITVAHNYWAGNWSTIITVFGWLLLFQGFIRIYCPKYAIDWLKKITQSKAGLLWIGWIFLIIGTYLSYAAFSSLSVIP